MRCPPERTSKRRSKILLLQISLAFPSATSLSLTLPPSSSLFKSSCGYIGSFQRFQDNLPILKSVILITSTKTLSTFTDIPPGGEGHGDQNSAYRHLSCTKHYSWHSGTSVDRTDKMLCLHGTSNLIRRVKTLKASSHLHILIVQISLG